MDLVRAEPQMMPLPKAQYYLIQYSKCSDCLMHAVVHRTDIVLPLGEEAKTRVVQLKMGKQFRAAIVLAADNMQKRVLEQLARLKINCFELAQAERQSVPKSIDIHATPWLLIQYSCTASSVAYAIHSIQQLQFLARKHNDIFAYIHDDGILRRGIILHASGTRKSAKYVLRNLRSHCLTPMLLPLPSFVPMAHQRILQYQLQLQKLLDNLKKVNMLAKLREKPVASALVVNAIRAMLLKRIDRIDMEILREIDLITLQPPILS